MQHFKALQYTARVNQGLTKHLGQLMLHMTYSRQCKSGHPDGKLTNVGDSFELFRFPLVQQGFMAQLMLTCIIPAYVSLSKTLNLKESCFCRAECQFLCAGRKWKETFSAGSIKYHFVFMKVAPGFYTGNLFSAPIVMETFAWSLTFLSYVTAVRMVNSNINGLINFSFCCCGRFV